MLEYHWRCCTPKTYFSSFRTYKWWCENSTIGPLLNLAQLYKSSRLTLFQYLPNILLKRIKIYWTLLHRKYTPKMLRKSSTLKMLDEAKQKTFSNFVVWDLFRATRLHKQWHGCASALKQWLKNIFKNIFISNSKLNGIWSRYIRVCLPWMVRLNSFCLRMSIRSEWASKVALKWWNACSLFLL